ncbi:DNA replication/repair protein RecF [Niabella beijingensis]|uniref:DNA replication/repair protein RecF n=1 Tax=Niabella beijingensis TaxID=2872700 RepID=UPI001CBF6C50|nr:DNA replication and repair protein RecF [Niabella beijingensis]MBZ4191254.1 DNA replication and repair protein RecF [Niabella beijingensis]
MFQLNSIALLQFKNYTNRNFVFPEKVVAICGKNGVGKTNILDAIHYLCFTKSYFSSSDAVNVQQGAKGFRIDGNFTRNGNDENLVCILRENGKKEFSVNGELYDKFSKHIGLYPCVVIAPDDAVLITGGSEERRSFIDALISQLDPEYLKQLILYNKLLQQRNSFLKTAAERGALDESLLAVLDEQLIPAGNFLFNKRRDAMVAFLPKVKRLYTDIARREEPLSLLYESRLLEASFEELLQASRQKDIALQRTTLGVHRDDITLQLGSQPFKNIASQGQRKSLLFALKLTELEVLTQEKKFPPLLLLDDVFEKLDEDRISNLLAQVCGEKGGQVFITDTNRDRITQHMEAIHTPFHLIEL